MDAPSCLRPVDNLVWLFSPQKKSFCFQTPAEVAYLVNIHAICLVAAGEWLGYW